MVKLYLIRHGRTQGNTEGRYVGRTDEDVLPSELKRLRWLKEEPLPDRIYVSPLKRCVSTAFALFQRDHIERGLFLRPIRKIPDLREMDFGAFEYKNFKELRKNADYQRYIDSNGEAAFPEGESRADFVKRTVKAGGWIFEELTGPKYRNRDVCAALVVHGGTIMALMEAYAVPKRDYFSWQVKNGEGFAVSLNKTEDGFVLSDVEKIAVNEGVTDD